MGGRNGERKRQQRDRPDERPTDSTDPQPSNASEISRRNERKRSNRQRSKSRSRRSSVDQKRTTDHRPEKSRNVDNNCSVGDWSSSKRTEPSNKIRENATVEQRNGARSAAADLETRRRSDISQPNTRAARWEQRPRNDYGKYSGGYQNTSYRNRRNDHFRRNQTLSREYSPKLANERRRRFRDRSSEARKPNRCHRWKRRSRSRKSDRSNSSNHSAKGRRRALTRSELSGMNYRTSLVSEVLKEHKLQSKNAGPAATVTSPLSTTSASSVPAPPAAPATPPPPPPPPLPPTAVMASIPQPTIMPTAIPMGAANDANSMLHVAHFLPQPNVANMLQPMLPGMVTLPPLPMPSCPPDAVFSMANLSYNINAQAMDVARLSVAKLAAHKRPVSRLVRPNQGEPNWQICHIDRYELLREIGVGTYGQVFKAVDKDTGGLVALKKVRMEEIERDGFPITAFREIKILRRLNHPNVVRLLEIATNQQDPIGFMKERGAFYLVFEYMDHDLMGLLESGLVHFSEANVCYIMRELLSALVYCHSESFMHRDIKCSNILVNNKGEVKLADLGLARLYEKDNERPYTNKVITLWYRPPELLYGEEFYGPKVDLWSTGCILGELFTKKPIFQGNSEAQQLELVLRVCGSPTLGGGGKLESEGQSKVRLKRTYPRVLREAFKFLPPKALDLLDQLLVVNPSGRCTAEEALSCPWIKEADAEQLKLPKLPEWQDCHELVFKKRRKAAKQNMAQNANASSSQQEKARSGLASHPTSSAAGTESGSSIGGIASNLGTDVASTADNGLASRTDNVSSHGKSSLPSLQPPAKGDDSSSKGDVPKAMDD